MTAGPSSTVTPGSGPERRVALIKPEPATDDQAAHAIQLFDSVLWVFKGTTRSKWMTAPLESADIVVVHHSEPVANVERWRKQGKHIITLSTDEHRFPPGQSTLLYPFPAVQVLSMLERIEAEMETGNTGVHVRPVIVESIQPGADPWSFVEALRTLRVVSNASMWLVCKGQNGPLLWLQGDGSRYFCDNATAAAIRNGSLNLSGLTLQKGTPPPGNLISRAGVELFWFATYHASPSLAPWLNDRTSYRVARWPDFGRVRAFDAGSRMAQIRIVAALDLAPASIAKLASKANATIDQTTRTLNALSSCALVEAAAVAAAVKTPRADSKAPVPAGGFRNFLRSMRKHLRLGVDA